MILIISFHTNNFKYSKWLNSAIWPIDRTLTGTTTPGQSGPASKVNERVFHISQNSKTGIFLLDRLVSYQRH